MIDINGPWAVARGFVAQHLVEVLMAVIATLAVTLLLTGWSLLRRRGTRRLARAMRDLQRRTAALERAEQERTVRRIVASDHPSP